MANIAQFPPQNYQAKVGFANAFHARSDTITQNGVVVDGALHSVIIPAPALVYNGSRALIIARGQNSGNTGAKTLTIRLNGGSDRTISLPAVAAAVLYKLVIDVIRINNVVVSLIIKCETGHTFNPAAVALTITGCSTSPAVNNLDTLTNTIDFFVSVPNVGDNVTMSSSHALVV